MNIERDFKVFEINGETKHLGIFGDPVEHSFSPKMHNFISGYMGNNYVYGAYLVRKEELEKAIEGLRAMNFSGVNITAPHKVDVMKYVDVLSEKATLFQSVNTIVNKNGVLYGYTTDADGFYESLKRIGCNIKDKNVLFIGAGGATRPVVSLFAMEGAKSITIKNRTKEKAEIIAKHVKETLEYDVNCELLLSHYDVVINTTPIGMYPEVDAMPEFDMSLIDETSYVADMIYNPSETLFLKEAKKSGAKTVNGLGMLIYQGMIAYELFTDTKLPVDMYDKIIENVFNK